MTIELKKQNKKDHKDNDRRPQRQHRFDKRDNRADQDNGLNYSTIHDEIDANTYMTAG